MRLNVTLISIHFNQAALRDAIAHCLLSQALKRLPILLCPYWGKSHNANCQQGAKNVDVDVRRLLSFRPMRHDLLTLQSISHQFRIDGEFLTAEPYGSGHINDTYRSSWRINGQNRDFILQRINHNVFKQPPQLMDNILRVTTHLRHKLERTPGADPDRETLTVVPTHDGLPYYQDAQGHYWRTYIFIRDAMTVDTCTDPNLAYHAAKAFGRFQADLADIPGGRLHDTIPFFHHTPTRFRTLQDAIAKDAFNRCRDAKPDIAFCLQHEALTSVIVDCLKSGAFPERITHNDTKIDNVMLDTRSGEGVCVIDLDTVMSGCALYDFGDMVRTFTRPTPEDERDLGQVVMDRQMLEPLVRGYLDSARSFLTPVEIEHLIMSGMLITFTIGIRFLTDYLSGDVYFKVHRPGQNLDRSRVQFKMIQSMEAQESAMQAIVRTYAS